MKHAIDIAESLRDLDSGQGAADATESLGLDGAVRQRPKVKVSPPQA
jgi:hypothetical protein